MPEDMHQILLQIRAFCQVANYLVQKMILGKAEGSLAWEGEFFYMVENTSSFEIFMAGGVEAKLFSFDLKKPLIFIPNVYLKLAREMASYHFHHLFRSKFKFSTTEQMIWASWFESEETLALYQLELMAL